MMDFWELYDRQYPQVRRFILSLVKDEWVADDLIQETFLRVQAKLHTVKDPSKTSAWVFSIAHNLCQDHFRSVKSRPTTDEFPERNSDACGRIPSVQSKMEQLQMSQCVQDMTNLLPESLRTVIVLYDLMACSHKEIAEILGISVENAKVRLHRARSKMKEILNENCTFQLDERNVLTCVPQTDKC